MVTSSSNARSPLVLHEALWLRNITYRYHLLLILVLLIHLSPEGTPKGEPKVVQLFLLPFYCGLRRVFDTFNLLAEIRQKKNLIMFYLMGWDGWMDGTEYQKCPLIFFILCGYIDKVYTYLYM